MKDWIKAYWQYRLDKSEKELTLKIDWLSFFFWAFIFLLTLKQEGIIR